MELECIYEVSNNKKILLQSLQTIKMNSEWRFKLHNMKIQSIPMDFIKLNCIYYPFRLFTSNFDLIVSREMAMVEKFPSLRGKWSILLKIENMLLSLTRYIHNKARTKMMEYIILKFLIQKINTQCNAADQRSFVYIYLNITCIYIKYYLHHKYHSQS